MKTWVVDASMAVKWFLPDAPDETDIDRALALLELGATGQARFIQPPHWVAEVAAVLARRIPDTAADNVADLRLFEFVEVIDEVAVFRRAVELSVSLDHHLFDTLYHALALARGTTLITADRRYYAKAAGLGGIVTLEDGAF
ncbi:type II toxin-antitoxin system VapC family toxin [Methylomagnum sp.]